MALSPKPDTIIQQLARKQHAPVYFLQGLEPFYIDEIVTQAENLLSPEQSKLNLVICHGKEMTISKIISHISTISMLGGKRVVIVKNAQAVEDIHRKSGQDTLLRYIENPHPDNLLVLAYKGKQLPTNSSLAKSLTKKGFLITCSKIYERDLGQWLDHYVTSLGYKITPDANVALQGLVGPQLQLLAKELKKIIINLSSQEEITQDTIIAYVGMQKDVNNFALQKALGCRDKKKAIEIAQYLAQNSKQYPLLPLLSLLTTFFTKVLQLYQETGKDAKVVAAKLKIHPYFIKEYWNTTKCYKVDEVINAIHYLHEADLQVKGIGMPSLSEGAILEELVVKILLQ